MSVFQRIIKMLLSGKGAKHMFFAGNRIALCLMMSCAFSKSNAQDFFFPVREASEIHTAAQIKASNGFNDTIVVKQDKWDAMVASSGTWQQNLKFKSVHAFVKFYVDHAYDPKVLETYTFRLLYTIHGYTNPNDTTQITVINDTLTISYAPDSLASYQDKQYKKYSGFHKIMVVSTALYKLEDNNPPQLMDLSTLGPFMELNFNIEATVQVQPYHKRVNPGSGYISVYGPSAPAMDIGSQSPSNDYLPVRWKLQGASWGATELTPVNYELEWTYIDDYSVNASTGAITERSASSLNYDFSKNATRVTLDTTYYRIPLIYQKGYILYRVRMVRPDSIQYRYPVYGAWSMAATGTVSGAASDHKYKINNSHLNDSVNWQYTVSFAEEGKYKHVMSYYDGLLKNRQSLTRFNSRPDMLIATEQIYDYEGRPSISILPTPMSSPKFSYVPDLSINARTQLPYRAADFDTLAGVCPLDPLPDSLAYNAKANMYYSPLNVNKAGFHKYIPDAGGYPFVQTIYSPGYDDRVDKQGGAGDSLQIGYGHFVKNVYVGAEQFDLNRMFGLNIGRAGFYRKTVSRDPNGQISLNTRDFRGNTVASSLIGIPDTMKHALIPNTNVSDTSVFREDYLAGTIQQIVGNRRILDKNFFNDAGGNNDATYIYRFTPYQTFCPAQYLSVKAKYEYSIFDECGVLVAEDSATLGTTGVQTSPAVLSDSSNAAFYMEQGKHSLNKVLTVNPDEVWAAVDEFMELPASENCLKTEEWFIKEEVINREYPCPKPFGCGLVCDSEKERMMNELWPNKDSMYVDRKYGHYTLDSLMRAQGKTNSIFRTINRVTKQMINIDTIAYEGSGPGYLVLLNGDTLFYGYPFDCLELPDTIYKFGRAYTDLRYLPLDTLIMIFNDELAEALLPLHPEYCDLLSCYNDGYADFLLGIPDATFAENLGVFSLEDMIENDTLYSIMLTMPGTYPNPKDTLSRLPVNVSIDTLAMINAYCQCGDTVMLNACTEQVFTEEIRDMVLSDPHVRNGYFDMARQLYIGSRLRFVHLLRGDTTGCDDCIELRLDLVEPPIFPPQPRNTLESFTSWANSIDSNASSQIQAYTHFMNLDSLQASYDSAIAIYNSYNSQLCLGAIQHIVARFSNCADSATLVNVGNTLTDMCDSGLVNFGNFTPDQIRHALVSNGITLTDLCNPYLSNFDFMYPPMPGGAGKFSCLTKGYYEDALATLDGNPLNALKNTGTAYNVTLSGSNLFEEELIAELGGTSVQVKAAYDAGQLLYTLMFYSATDTVRLYFRTDEAGCGSSAFSGTVSIVGVDCINNIMNGALSGIASGYIGRYTFGVTLEKISGGQPIYCYLLSWTDKVPMASTQMNDLAGCVPCTQMKSLYNEFKDTLTAYNIKGTDHPYYPVMLRNFMNYRLTQPFGADEYIAFIESCALSDSLELTRYNAYGSVTFTSSGAANSFMNNMQAIAPASSVVPMLRIHNGSNVTVLYDFNTLPVKKLKIFKDTIAAYGSGVVNEPFIPYSTTDMGRLYIPVSSSFEPDSVLIFGSAPHPFSFSETGTKEMRIGNGPLMNYTEYTVTAPGAATVGSKSKNTYLLQLYLRNEGVPGFFMATRTPAIHSQYDLPEKMAYLAYVYGNQDQAPSSVLDSLQSYRVKPAINLFDNHLISYAHPARPDLVAHLYFADSAIATDNTHYAKIGYILDAVQDFQTYNCLFYGGLAPITIINTSTERLDAIWCGDGTYWFRYFGVGDTMYNIFFPPPGGNYKSIRLGGYAYNSFGFNPGDSISYSFHINATSSMYPSMPLRVNAFTDFAVARNSRLEDVLLGYDDNTPIRRADTGYNCERMIMLDAVRTGKIKYKLYMDSVRNRLYEDFFTYIMHQGIKEELHVGYRSQKFNYTLYFYDRAGNLMRTVPPAGVDFLANNMLNTVNTLRSTNGFSMAAMPQHTKPSNYKYNSLDQVYEQTTPDAGRTVFFYDAAGRVVFSQNARQRATGHMSYTLYDKLGRIIETGQSQIACEDYFDPYTPGLGYQPPPPCSYLDVHTQMYTPYPPVVNNLRYISHEDVTAYMNSVVRTDVITTFYDTEIKNLGLQHGMSRQENLRNRVSAVCGPGSLYPGVPRSAVGGFKIYFSYDIAGNVKTLTREMAGLNPIRQGFKRIDYDYDVISGKVNMLSYNRGFGDQFYQRYGYDDDNRIVSVETSNDGYIWDNDARYEYYDHGPLARMSLGDLRVQGVDYAYTIQGWLKAINGDMLDTLKDMGLDSWTSNVHAGDAVSLTLDYFKGDYRPIGDSMVQHLRPISKSLYNGNIPRMQTNIRPFDPLSAQYAYDQLNRIMQADYAYYTNEDTALTATADYYSNYAYDPDGNLQKLVRYGNNPMAQLMDSITYYYQSGHNNRLRNITDHATNNYTNDLKLFTNNSVSRYQYDASGNMVQDLVSGINKIIWNNYDKVTDVLFDSTRTHAGMGFRYDGLGHRYSKVDYGEWEATNLNRFHYYVRDAEGNILATYDYDKTYEFDIREIVTRIFVPTRPNFTQVKRLLWDMSSVQAVNIYPFLATAMLETDMGLATAQISSVPVSYFVTSNNAVHQNMLAHTGDYPDFYSSMANYDNNNDTSLLGDALFLYGLETPLHELLDFMWTYGDEPVQNQIIEALCTHADSLYAAVLAAQGIGGVGYYDSISCDQQGQYVRDYVGHFPATDIHDIGMTDSFKLSYREFLRALTSNDVIIGYPGYYGPSEPGVLMSSFNNALSQYADITLLGSFLDSWEPAMELLQNTNSPAALLGNLLSDTTSTAIDNFFSVHDEHALVNAYMAASPYNAYALNQAALSTGYWTYDTLKVWGVWPKEETFKLSSHHIYGSSRLGVKDYLPGQVYSRWDYADGDSVNFVIDTSTISRRAWYSMAYNDNISGLVTQPWGATDMSSYYTQRIIGRKQFELTNHLGNVLGTLSDLPYRYVSEYGQNTQRKSPAMRTAYDYYPFGSLKPGRYVMDSTAHCMTITKTQWVTKWVDTFEWVYQRIPFTWSWGVMPDYTINMDNSVTVNLAEDNTFTFTVDVLPDVTATLDFSVLSEEGSVALRVWEDINGADVTLTNINVAYGETSTPFNVTPKTNQVRVTGTRTSTAWTGQWVKVWVSRPVLVQENVLVEVCDSVKDRYDYGFNGMYKDNDLKGIGNSYDFSARLLDTRIGRWLSIDPLAAKYPWLSPFNFGGNNPIYFTDPDGKEIHGFNALKENKNTYKTATEIISSSEVFMKFLSQFASSTNGDKIGNHADGRRSWLNLTFTLINDNSINNQPFSSCGIEVHDGNNWVAIESFNGTLSSDNANLIRVHVKLVNHDKYMSTGSKILEVSHETVLHGGRHADMVEKFRSGNISFKELKEYHINIGDKQHLEIFNGSNKLYEQVNDDVQSILDKDNRSDNLEENGKGYHGKTPNQKTLNKNGYVPLSQSFEYERNLEKETTYNPEHCGKMVSGLNECD